MEKGLKIKIEKKRMLKAGNSNAQKSLSKNQNPQ
jgi:hypothetical protein